MLFRLSFFPAAVGAPRTKSEGAVSLALLAFLCSLKGGVLICVVAPTSLPAVGERGKTLSAHSMFVRRQSGVARVGFPRETCFCVLVVSVTTTVSGPLMGTAVFW